MISELTKRQKPGKNEYYTFTVEIKIGEFSLESTGWWFFPANGRVEPPKTRRGKNWFPTIKGVTDEVRQILSEQVQALLSAGGDHVGSVVPESGQEKPEGGKLSNSDLTSLFKDDPQQFKKAFPGKYREFYIAASGSEIAALFDDLPEGRLWPDLVLQMVGKLEFERKRTVWDRDFEVNAGIISPADNVIVCNFVAELGETYSL